MQWDLLTSPFDDKKIFKFNWSGKFGKKLENKDFPSMGLNIQLYNLGYFRHTNDWTSNRVWKAYEVNSINC